MVARRSGESLTATLARAPIVSKEQEKQPKWKDAAEYQMYSAVLKETDPKKKPALINTWKEKYAETEYKLARLQLYLNAYQQLNDFPNLLSTLNEMDLLQMLIP